MSRIIINNTANEVDDLHAIELVRYVVAGGRVSDEGRQYCYATTFNDPRVAVWTDRTAAGTDTFNIVPDPMK